MYDDKKIEKLLQNVAYEYDCCPSHIGLGTKNIDNNNCNNGKDCIKCWKQALTLKGEI